MDRTEKGKEMRKSKLGEGCGEAMRDDSMMEWGGRVEGGTE